MTPREPPTETLAGLYLEAALGRLSCEYLPKPPTSYPKTDKFGGENAPDDPLSASRVNTANFAELRGGVVGW